MGGGGGDEKRRVAWGRGGWGWGVGEWDVRLKDHVKDRQATSNQRKKDWKMPGGKEMDCEKGIARKRTSQLGIA